MSRVTQTLGRHGLADEGVAIAGEPSSINFVGAGVVATDDGDGTATVTVSGAPAGAAGGDLGGMYPNPTVDDGADGTAIHDDTAGEIAAITSKATLVGADVLLVEDSAAANAKKSSTVAGLRITESQITDLTHTDADAIHDNVAGEIAALTLVTAAAGDHILIEDATDTNNKKRVNASDFLAGGDVTKVGTPVDNQIGVWTGDGTIEGDANLTWDGSQLGAVSSGVPALFDRTSAVTVGIFTGAYVKHTTSGNMADTFGAGLTFQIEDSAAIANDIARIGAERDGADNSGSMIFETVNAGSISEKARILPSGNVGINETEPDLKLHVTDSGVPAVFERTSAVTTGIFTSYYVRHTTSGNMADGFGTAITFQIEDSAGVANDIGFICAEREGADNTGSLTFQSVSAGTANNRMKILPDGGILALALKSGTLAAPPGGLTSGELWEDTTDSAANPIVRINA